MKPIKFKRTKTAGLKPDVATISEGEIQMNLADKKIYTKLENEVISIGGGGVQLTVDTNPTNTDMKAGAGYLVSALVAGKTLTFPPAPNDGDMVVTGDITGKCAESLPLILLRNGSGIHGQAQDFAMTKPNMKLTWLFTTAQGWIIVDGIGETQNTTK